MRAAAQSKPQSLRLNSGRQVEGGSNGINSAQKAYRETLLAGPGQEDLRIRDSHSNEVVLERVAIDKDLHHIPAGDEILHVGQ